MTLRSTPLLHFALIVAAATVIGNGCSSSGSDTKQIIANSESETPGTRDSKPMPPRQVFDSIEQGLIRASVLGLDFTAASSGAFQANLSGTYKRSGESCVDLRSAGTFGPDKVDLFFETVPSDSGLMLRGGNAAPDFNLPMPSETHTAVMIGLMRMGVLHNLARLTAGSAPDHANGGADTWVTAGNLSRESDTTLSFRIFVSGFPSGRATISYDPRTMLPTGRNQTVEFPGGSMDVVETYNWQSVSD